MARINIPIDVEFFFQMLFGSSAHGLVGEHGLGLWRRYCRRLVVHLRRYINANIVTDRAHRRRIEIALGEMEAAIRSPQRETRMVAALAELCLLLIGDMLSHWRKRAVNRAEHFLLDSYRSVHYTQTPEQRARAIWQSWIKPRLKKDPPDDAARPWEAAYFAIHKKPGHHAAFVERFREAHPQAFHQLFG